MDAIVLLILVTVINAMLWQVAMVCKVNYLMSLHHLTFTHELTTTHLSIPIGITGLTLIASVPTENLALFVINDESFIQVVDQFLHTSSSPLGQ